MSNTIFPVLHIFIILLVLSLIIWFYYSNYLVLTKNSRLLQKKHSDLEEAFEKRVKERTKELEKARDSVSAYAVQKFELAQELELKNTEIIMQKDFILKQSEKLREAYDEINKLDGFKRQMTGMIIHDLKNPINVILNLADMSGVPEKTGNVIRQLSYEMLDLIMNILEVQKFEEAAMRVEEENIVLISIVRDSVESLSYLMKNSGIGLLTSIPPDLNITADRHIFKRILGNLLSNSIKNTPSGGSIEITAMNSGEEVRIELKDTGRGVHPDELGKVFELYKSGKQNSLKDNSTGIGLAYCRMGVEAHGGKIGIQSVFGEGTTVWFTMKKGALHNDISGEGYKPFHLNSVSIPELFSEDLIILRPLSEKLKNAGLFEVTKILSLTGEISPDSNERISKWKSEVEDAVFSADQNRFRQLIDL
jgi:signal transduction histidine kinase